VNRLVTYPTRSCGTFGDTPDERSQIHVEPFTEEVKLTQAQNRQGAQSRGTNGDEVSVAWRNSPA
jgi:hypothetical protein